MVLGPSQSHVRVQDYHRELLRQKNRRSLSWWGGGLFYCATFKLAVPAVLLRASPFNSYRNDRLMRRTLKRASPLGALCAMRACHHRRFRHPETQLPRSLAEPWCPGCPIKKPVNLNLLMCTKHLAGKSMQKRRSQGWPLARQFMQARQLI